MCGIVGHISTSAGSGFSWKAEKVFNSLLFADTVRGDDATGIFLVEEDGKTTVMKEALPAPWVMGGKEHVDIMKDAFSNGKFIVGHNRKATVGKVNDETSHPFVINDELVLVHNGTLFTYKHLMTDPLSDSHSIAHVLHGTDLDDDEALSKAFFRFNGAYALVFYDRRKETFYMTRNAQRPLHIAFVENNGWFFASEKEMLFWILARNELKIKHSFELEINKLYKMKLDEEEFTIKEIKPFFPLPPHTTPTTTTEMAWAGDKLKKLTQNSTDADGRIPNSHLKKFRRNFIQRQIDVVIDDVMEVQPGEPIAYGRSSAITLPHAIQIPLLPEDCEELKYLTNPRIKGVIKSVKTQGSLFLLEVILKSIYHDVQSTLTH